MGNFKSQRSFRPRRDEAPQMHKATCSKCGNSCMVPFKPTGNRPIFCADCFKSEGSQRRDDAGFSTSDRRMYDAICDNCGNRCQVPFQPSGGKPVYCSHCFEQREKEGRPFRERPQDTEQFTVLNQKLDKILDILERAMQEPSTSKPEVFEEVLADITEEKPEKKTIKKKATKKKS